MPYWILEETYIVLKKKMLLMTFILFIGLLVSGLAYRVTKKQVLYSIAIAVGTTFYHFAMRLAVAYTIDTKFHNHMDYTKGWFQERKFEPKFYKMMRVKKWKKCLPSFNPEDFLLKKHSIPDIIQVTCQAEIVHEVIMALSFVPVIASVYFGAVEIFLITSCASFLFDGIFVILQRYNRPRLMGLIKKQPLAYGGKTLKTHRTE